MTKAKGDENIMGKILIDMVSSRFPVSMLQINVLEQEISDDTPELPFLYS
jgi:hypothetical protein